MIEPYTHQQHAKRCREAAQASLVLSNQLVQVRKHGVVYCARIAAAYTVPNGPDCWTVESITPEVARFTVPCRQTVLCGDYKCACFVDAAGKNQSQPQAAEIGL